MCRLLSWEYNECLQQEHHAFYQLEDGYEPCTLNLFRVDNSQWPELGHETCWPTQEESTVKTVEGGIDGPCPKCPPTVGPVLDQRQTPQTLGPQGPLSDRYYNRPASPAAVLAAYSQAEASLDPDDKWRILDGTMTKAKAKGTFQNYDGLASSAKSRRRAKIQRYCSDDFQREEYPAAGRRRWADDRWKALDGAITLAGNKTLMKFDELSHDGKKKRLALVEDWEAGRVPVNLNARAGPNRAGPNWDYTILDGESTGRWKTNGTAEILKPIASLSRGHQRERMTRIERLYPGGCNPKFGGPQGPRDDDPGNDGGAPAPGFGGQTNFYPPAQFGAQPQQQSGGAQGSGYTQQQQTNSLANALGKLDIQSAQRATVRGPLPPGAPSTLVRTKTTGMAATSTKPGLKPVVKAADINRSKADDRLNTGNETARKTAVSANAPTGSEIASSSTGSVLYNLNTTPARSTTSSAVPQKAVRKTTTAVGSTSTYTGRALAAKPNTILPKQEPAGVKAPRNPILKTKVVVSMKAVVDLN